MARYGITVYGTDYYGELTDSSYDATPFTASASGYDSVRLDWRVPGGNWRTQRLVRNVNGYSISPADGTTLFTEAQTDGTFTQTHAFSDSGLTSGRFYYYTLFLLDPNGHWVAAGHAQVLTPKDYGYSQRIFDLLPAIMQTGSTEQLGDGVLADTDSFLHRFLSVFGNELDYLRTEYDLLGDAFDARKVSLELLPALSRQLGFSFEPQLGARAQRRLVANAVHLYATKGTIPGTRELATVVTGWDSGVRIGYNLALDDLDAGQKGSQGRWTGVDNSARVAYAPNHGGALPLDLPGYLDIVARGQRVDAVINMDHGGGDPELSKQYAVPIIQGRTYTTSMFANGPRDDSSLAARMRVTWLDVKGRSLGYDTDGDDQIISAHWSARPFVTLTAPVGARYLQAALVYTAQSGLIAGGERLQALGFMVDESDQVRPWQCAREVIVQLRAEMVNETSYPRPGNDPDANVGYWYADNGINSQSNHFGQGNDHYEFTVYDNTKANFYAWPKGYYTSAEAVDHVAGTPYFLSVDVLGSANDRGFAFTTVTLDQNGTASFTLIEASKTQSIAWIGGTPTDAPGSVYQRITHVLPPDYFGSNVKQVIFGVTFFSDHADGTQMPKFIYGETFLLRNWGVYKSFAPVDYFDGGTDSETSDYLWEGLQFASRSHRYTQRIPRTQRLRALLKDFLPNQACYQLEFAQPPTQVYASAAAIEGLNVNTGTPPPPPPVGRSTSLLWTTEANNGRSLTVEWDTKTNTVSRDLAVDFNTRAVAGNSLLVRFNDKDTSGPVGANLEVDWAVRQTTAYFYVPPTDPTSAGWTGSAGTDRWTLHNVSDGNYVYPGYGPMNQSGTYVETAVDGTVRTGSYAIPNQGESRDELVQAPAGTVAAVRDVVFYGASGEVIYHWYNRTQTFSTPRTLTVQYNVEAAAGYAGGYTGGY